MLDNAGTPSLFSSSRADRDALPRFTPCASIPGVPWHCLYTKPQSEIRAEVKLRQEGAAAWVPQLHDGQRIRPLFPRYLFMQMTGERTRWGFVVRNAAGEELGSVLRSPAGTPLAVPLPILEALWSQCHPNGVIYLPEPVPLRPITRGASVRVTDGPFAGLRGICQRSSSDRVRVLLSMLGGNVPTTLPRTAVEAV